MVTLAATDSLRSVNPATLDVVGEVPAAGPDEIAEAVARAARVQERWRAAGDRERRARFEALLDVLLDRADEIAATITAETGKPLIESYSAELYVSAEAARWVGGAAERLRRPQRLVPPRLVAFKRAHVLREPLGVVAVVSPWNFPLGVPFTQVAAAVAMGNAVVLKPSELAPLTGRAVGELFDQAGFPPGLVRVLHGRGDIGRALVAADGVAKVMFTGSATTGRSVAASLAPLLRPVTLELGGKDPMLVFADSDRKRALAGALWGSFTNCGQVCAGAERIYVERRIYDEFVAELSAATGRLRIGDGRDPATDLGPLITGTQRERVEALVADAVDNGARVTTGGRRPETGLPGWFHEPTVLAGERIEGRIAEEELFGPVVTVEPFDSEEDAVRLANASAYGLGASVWTRSSARARRVALRLEAGSVWMNDIAYSYFVAKAPWGGTKSSGYGRTHGADGLREVSRTKVVDADTGRLPVPWWYPYRAEALDGFRGALDLLYRRDVASRGRGAVRRRDGIAHLAKRYVGRG